MIFISALIFSRFLWNFMICRLRWMLFFHMCFSVSVHVLPSISTSCAKGGHAYCIVKTNEEITCSDFYVFYICVSETDFPALLLHNFLSTSLTFWWARVTSFGSIFEVIFDGLGSNLASKILQEAFQETSTKKHQILIPIFIDFGVFWRPPGAREIAKKC